MKKLKSKAFFINSFLIHILLSIVVVLVSWQIFEPNAYNFMIKNFSARQTGSDDIVVIVIDDKSIAYHRWPWKRELYADIFEYLHEYGKPKLIGYDAIVSTLDAENPNSDKKFFSTLNKIDNLVVGFSPLVEKYPAEVNGELYSTEFSKKFGINVDDKRKNAYISKYQSFSMFPTPYFNAVKHSGSVSTTQDPSSGYLIISDQIVTVDKKRYPSIALRMYMLLNQANKLTLKNGGSIDGNNIIVDKTGLKIPAIDSPNGVYSFIHFYKVHEKSEYTHKKYSAIDLITSLENIKAGKKPIIDPAEFNNKIVFVGANAKAAALGLEDALPTPILQKHPGVDLQATNLDNLINNQFIKQSTLGIDLLVILIFSIATFVVISRFSFFQSIGILIVMAFGYIGASILCYMNNLAINVITPLAIQLITMIFAYSYRFILEGRHKEKIKNAMGRYLSQDIMKNVVKNIDDIKLGGKKANVTVLFADIRGFTSMSERMTAEEVSVILNEYFTEIEPIISKYNGVINKFIGDAVMAIFGEPIQDINHPQNAVKCAYEMLKKVEQLQDKWILEGKPKIEIGIGINTGEAFVGNIGSEKRLEYTVIGDTVNLASRIETYNKVYKTNFLISSSTYSFVSNITDVIKISEVSIRGKAKKMDIYEVLRLSKN